MNSLPLRMTGTKKGKKNKRSGNSAVELVSRSQWDLALHPPSIYFDKPKSKEKSDDEGNYKKIEVPLDPQDSNSNKIERKVRLFGGLDTSTEAWVKWRIELEEVFRDYPINIGEKKTSMALALIKGRARENFQNVHNRLLEKDAKEPMEARKTQEEIFSLTIAEVGKSYFPILHAYQKQIAYMKFHLRLGSHTVRNFAMRLRELNSYLPYYPREEGKI